MSDDDQMSRHDRGPAPRRAAPPEDEETPAEQKVAGSAASSGPLPHPAGSASTPASSPHSQSAAGEVDDQLTSIPRPPRRGRPSRAADDPDSAPSHKTMLIGTIIALVMVTIVGVVVYAINSVQPAGPSSTPTATSTWTMELPVQIGSYTRDPNATNAPSTEAGTTTTSATYATKGQDAVVVLMSRPQTDLRAFMDDAGMNSVSEQQLSDKSGSAQCGIDPDHNDTGCVVLQENTAVLVLALLNQSRQDLADLAQQVARQTAGQ